MKNSISVLSILLLGLSFSLISCAKSHVVESPETAYDSLGVLELKVAKDRGAAKYLTFGMVRHHSYEAMTRKLRKQLAAEARKKYGADAVTNITFWPKEDSREEFYYLYGRGEMIRYRKFSSAPPVSASRSEAT